MTRQKRNLITILFFLVFAVTAPAVILYTGGFRYNWKKHGFEKTGIIQIDSTPENAAIFLNGVEQTRLTPATLGKLLPDDYAVRLEKAGFLPWEKTLSVRSGETAFASDITLFKDALPRQVFRADVKAAAFSSDGRAALLRAVGDDVVELIAAGPANEPPALLARFGAGELTSEEIAWSPGGAFVSFSARRQAGGQTASRPVLFIYPMDPEREPVAVHELLAEGIADVDPRFKGRWSVDDERMTVMTSKGVFLVGAASGSAASVMAGPAAADALADDRVYVIRTQQRTDGQESVLERTGPGGRAPLERLAVFPPGRHRFVALRRGLLLVADDATGKMSLVETGSGAVLRTFMATNAVWDREGAHLLLWNDFEIAVYDPETDDRAVVTRIGRPITLCVWHPDGKHVLYATDTDIAAIELDVRDRKNIYDLGRFTEVKTFAVDPAGDWLRAVGSVGSQEGVFERDL